MTRAEFCAFARAHDNFVILTHRRPDGDTIGSASALCLGLRQLGKTAFVLTQRAVHTALHPVFRRACLRGTARGRDHYFCGYRVRGPFVL